MTVRLKQREKWFLGLGGVGIGLVLLWALAAQPALERMKRLDAAIARQYQAVEQLQDMVEQWQRINAQSQSLIDRLNQREADFSLAGYLEELIEATGLNDKLKAMKPLPPQGAAVGLTRVSVEMKLAGLSMEELVKLLYRIEFSEKMLTITRLGVVEVKSGLEVGMRVLTLARPPEQG
ncbi:MAG: type II secretion system protein M [Deltaproteobacteria bacterium]|nr:type II secretion system protein M [Deltaproteobacteria bacterium]